MTYNPDEYAQYDDEWTRAPDDSGPPSGPVPPGTYQCAVDKVDLKDSQYDGHPQLTLRCKILNGPQTGRFCFPQGSFNPDAIVPTRDGNKAPIEFLKQMITRMELDPPVRSASELVARLAELLDRIIEVKVVRNEKRPDYPRYYVQRFVGMAPEREPGADFDEAYPPPIDDEIQF